MRPVFLFAVLLLWSSFTYAQLDNRVFEDRRNIDEADSGKLFLGLNLLGFGKNNEYDNTIIQGYTLFGYQLNPYLSYHINKNWRVDGGVYLQKDFGNSRFTTVAPTLSVKFQRKAFSVIFGNLESSLNHRLIEPLYDFERVLNNRLENGLQATLIRDGIFLDTWVDWHKMIYVNDPQQEQLIAGMNLTKRVVKSGDTEITLPVQLLAHHSGGQINFSHQGPIETLFNSAVGTEIKHYSAGFVREVRLNGFYVYYKTITSDLLQPFKDGSAAYANINVATRIGLDVMGSYWRGHEFISIEGGKIYPSVSVFDYTRQQHVMNLFILRFLYSVKLREGLYASARAEPYYDFSYGTFQYSYALYLNFRDRFFLWKRNKS